MSRSQRFKPAEWFLLSPRRIAEAFALCEQGEEGGIASVVTLLMGLRASEVTELTGGYVDDGGRVLWVAADGDGKTATATRQLLVPEVVRPYLLRLARSKGAEAKLFSFDRHALLRWVQAICRSAGVPVVTAHGMRGLHATLAVGIGATSEDVVKALGHTSFTVTKGHYAST